MQIILTKNVKKLGKKGEVKTVSAGYAGNFLFPKKYAIPATPQALKAMQDNATRGKNAEQRKAQEIDKIIKVLTNVHTFSLQAKTRQGKLFGSITKKDVAECLRAHAPSIQPDMIRLKKPIRQIGTYEIPIAPEKASIVKIQFTVHGEEA